MASFLRTGKQPAADYNIYALRDSSEVRYYLRKNDCLAPLIRTGSAGFRDEIANGRIQAASCYQGLVLNLVVRGKKEKQLKVKGPDGAVPVSEPFCSGFEPDPEVRKDFLNSVREVCEPITDFLFPADKTSKAGEKIRVAHKGLLIVSGATNSMKTNIANGLIHLYLESRMREWWTSGAGRKPHLVTFEDPIESYFIEWKRIDSVPFKDEVYSAKGSTLGWEGSDLCKNWHKFPDYTPRLKGTDVMDLSQAVSDALRQTPTVFYSAETRLHSDWPALFKLAESHLVVTTTHSSSIAAAFNGLIAGLETRTPAQRSELASILLGVVHMRPGSYAGIGYNLPCLWRRTAYSTKAFAAEGLSSLVPTTVAGTPSDRKDLSNYFIGRQAFAGVLVGRSNQAPKDRMFPHKFTKWEESKSMICFEDARAPESLEPQGKTVEEVQKEVRARAIEWDLRGE